MAIAYDLSTWEVRVERSEVQGHPWQHTDIKANFGYMRPSLEKRGGGSKRWEERIRTDFQRWLFLPGQ